MKVFDGDLDYQIGKRLQKADSISIDTETDGLDYRKDKLRLVQVCTNDGRVYMVRNPIPGSINLSLVLLSIISTKIFHHAAFDLRFLKAGLRIETQGKIECTKTLMKIIHPEMKSGLGTATSRLFGIHLNKMAFNHGHWHDEELTREQLSYAANDVLYLPKLLKKLKQDASWADIAKYWRAMKVIPEKAFMEVEGYTDLWDYPQVGHAKALEQRNWWLDFSGEIDKSPAPTG